MTRRRRLSILTFVNCSFWALACYLSWERLIPERFVTVTMIVALVFSVPLGCCSLPLLVMAESRHVGGRTALYAALTLANSAAWAWLVERLWAWLSGAAVARPEPRGFPLDNPSSDDTAAE